MLAEFELLLIFLYHLFLRHFGLRLFVVVVRENFLYFWYIRYS